MQTFSKFLAGISLASAVFGAPQPGLDINIHLSDDGVSNGRDGFYPEKEVALLKFDEFKIERYLKPQGVGNLKWEGPWMMFNGENVHLPGVVSKPNAVLVEDTWDSSTIEAINGVSPSPSFGIESFWVTRVFDPEIWPQPSLVVSLLCEHPRSKLVTQTQERPIKKPKTPIKFDNWQPMICTKITFRIEVRNEKDGEEFLAPFSMDDLSIVWHTPGGQRQHGQLKA